MTASVDIVVVTYNSAAYIKACLASIADSEYDGTLRTIVVDNASTDATLEAARTSEADTHIIANQRNTGFAAACNQGIDATSGDLVLLLNPDARLEPTTLATLVAYLDEHPRVAIVGPRLLQEDGSLQRDISATGLFPSFRQALFEYTHLGRALPTSPWIRDYFLTDFDRVSNRTVAMVQGACFLFRRAILDEIGGLDTGYFLYFEETDFCKNAADRGWEIHYVGDAAAVHLGSHSLPGGRPSAHHFISSLYRFHRKHYGAATAMLLWLILMPYHGVRLIRLWVRNAFGRGNLQRLSDQQTAAERFLAHWTMLAPAIRRSEPSDATAPTPAAATTTREPGGRGL